MKHERPMTAAELMAKLDADPDFQKRRAEKQRRRAVKHERLRNAAQPILDELQSMGIVVASIGEMTQHFAPLPPQIVQVLLDWLPRVGEDRLKESIIRALGAAKEPFDGRPLVDVFLNDKSGTLRWPIANTMAYARPFGVTDWIVEAVKNRRFGSARQMLMLALARLAPAELALPVLLSVLDELPGHVAIALGEVGGASELGALRSRIGNVSKWEQAEFLKAICKIESRLHGSA
jgi:hypothetical protein